MNEEESIKNVLDLSKKCLKKVPKHEDAQTVRTLILDENDLQKIDNIDSYLKIEKLSLSKNQLLRMYGVCRLHHLIELNLSFNGILSIEGLKELLQLQYLNLEGNSIKTIEHLNTNLKLEYLNLSENSIASISDISYLKCLKELHLQGNRLTHLRQCDKYLPISLETLTLSKNFINDLNEICTLSNLCNLHSISLIENPCVIMTGSNDGFDHRPFVLNWCMSVKIIDNFMVDPIESLKAEWLYSQGRGRQFRVGEQAALARYLSSVCPLLGKALENENERKLRLILSKAQQHQRQLQEETSESMNTSSCNSPSSGRKKTSSRIQSPRFSRLGGRQGSPDTMSSSYHGNTTSSSIIHNDAHSNQNHIIQMTTSLIENIKNDSIMTQSCDGTGLNSNSTNHSKYTTFSSQDTTPRTPSQYNDQPSGFPIIGGPLTAASKMVPVPETLMSPDCCPTTIPSKINLSALNNQNIHSKINRNKEKKISSPKVARNSQQIKRNIERSPILSPRRAANHSSFNNQSLKSSTTENYTKNRQVNAAATAVAATSQNYSNAMSSDEDSDFNEEKLKFIRNKVAERNQKQKGNSIAEDKNPKTELSALVIQKNWRGYKSRKNTKDIAEKILKKRTLEYIEKLTKDMEMTKAQLENERKIQQLQMQAISALWKKVSTMQNIPQKSTETTTTNGTSGDTVPPSNVATVNLDNQSAAVVNDLTRTCTLLTNQVQQLQGSMHDILNCMTLFCNLPQENLKKIISSSDEPKDSISTQTEIIAVHTPQVENAGNFPFKIRPSSLPLESTSNNGGDTMKLTKQIIQEKDETGTNDKCSLDDSTLSSEQTASGQEQSDFNDNINLNESEA